MPETINIEPDYQALFNRFKRCAISTLESMSRKSAKTFSRKDVYDFVCTFRIAMGTVRNLEQFVQLRDEFDKAADKMYEAIWNDQEEN